MRKPVTIRRCTHARYRWCVFHPAASAGEPRQRSFFLTQPEAKAFAATREIEIQNHGTRHGAVSDAERAALVRFRTWGEQLEANAPELAEIVNLGILAWEKGRNRTLTVAAMCAARIDKLQRRKKSARHIADVENRLKRFTEQFGTRKAATLTAGEIERWLLKLDLSPVSLGNFKRAIGGAFAAAVKRHDLGENPVSGVELPEIKRGLVSILTVPEMTALLTAAPPEIRPLFVLQALSGCRRAEAERLTWAQIHLDKETPYVELSAEVTKTGDPRNVTLQPNAVGWLKLDRRPAGSSLAISPWDYQRLTREARTAAGLESWEGNVLRHSYGSYRLAKTMNAAMVAEEMGNSVGVLRKHYKRPIDPATVAAYWQILPQGEPHNVIPLPKKRRA